jgi:lysophospholipase L1-like esterase
VAQLNEITRSLSGRYGVLCLEWGDHPLARERQNFAADGFHPSLTGIRRAARAGAQALAAHRGIHIAKEEIA